MTHTDIIAGNPGILDVVSVQCNKLCVHFSCWHGFGAEVARFERNQV